PAYRCGAGRAPGTAAGVGGRRASLRSQAVATASHTSLDTGTPVTLVERPGAPPGLVIIPDIWGNRPLFHEMAERLSDEWEMSVAVVEPFPGQDIPQEMEARFAAVAGLDDDANLRDLVAAADRLGTERAVLIGFCMGGMYCY